jgi:hypothetical protein
MNAKRIEISLKDLILQRAKAEHPRTVKDLLEIVKARRPAVSEQEFLEAVRELKESGALELELPALKVNSYPSYLRLWEENAWFYLVLLVGATTVLAIYVLPSTYPAVILRWIVGSAFVLFLPGLAVVYALFPEEKELDSIERIALTVGLSLAITPLIGLVLNYTPWGIRLNPIVVSLSMFTLAMATVATFRRYKIAAKRHRSELEILRTIP